MGRQQATLKNVKSVAATVMAGLGLLILLGKMAGPAAQVDGILSYAARETMGLVPHIVPSAWRALQSYVLDHQGFSPCPLDLLVSCWSLIQVVAGAA